MPIVGSQKLLDDEMEHKPIFRDRYYAVVSDNNPLAGEESLSLRDLNSQTLIISNQRIMDVNLRYFPEHGFSYKNYMIVSDISELAILLAKSNTAVCTTCTKYSPEICQCLGIKQIPILDTGIQYNLVWKETRKLTTIQKDFKQFVFDYCKKLSNQK